MCGIVGYVGERESVPILVSGLKRLEYRGYDSAGVAVISRNRLNVVRAAGKLDRLERRLAAEPLRGTLGIGHTRWATHGRPSDENAHPHAYKGVAVVHNGIVENHHDLKERLLARRHHFSSETDSEVFAHLIADELDRGRELPDAVRAAIGEVKGTYALAVVSARDPGRIVCAQDSSPLVVGLGEGQNFLASDAPALLEHTRDFVYLEQGDLAVVSAHRVDILDRRGQRVNRATRRIDWTPAMAEKGGHPHFMHKEIWEQPRALADTLRGRLLLDEGDVHLDGWSLSAEQVRGLDRITLLACGTSWCAGLVGEHLIETLARIPVEVELASEFRYRDPIVDGACLAVAISQSGETADTLAAFKEARARGATGVAICNVMGSAVTREADFSVLTQAGPEIGVASTKAFTTQLAVFSLLAVKLGRLRGTLSAEGARQHLAQLAELPRRMEAALQCEPAVREVARELLGARDCLFLGRGPMHPMALEGALKLKEVSYVHAEGYAGGEMKHGPIALIDEQMPVLVLAPRQPRPAYEKLLGNVEEVRARGGKVIAVIEADDAHLSRLAHHVIRIPSAPALLAPMVAAIPLQLLAYHAAELRGRDVDQPRNLAKSVTVE